MENSAFRFHMPVDIRFGAGITAQLGDSVRGGSVLIVSDPFLYKNGTAQRLGAGLEGRRVCYFSDIEPNPSTLSVDRCAEAARAADAATIVGLGGGSSLDVAKVVSCLVTNPGSIYEYYAGGKKTFAPRTAALVLIPTTAGTGSEVTNVGVFTDPHAGIKMPFVTDAFWADTALIDPQLTYSLPAAVTASTGMDAFCHAIEAYWNKTSQPLCDAMALQAMKLILDNIYTAYAEPQNAAARGAMITASLSAGVAFSQTRTTGIHALSFPLTTEFHASHGTACAITLPAFIRACAAGSAAAKMAALAAWLGQPDALALADAVEAQMRSMHMPVRLHELGVQESDLEHITQVGLGAAIIQLTPAVMDHDSVYALLKAIL